MLVVSCSDDIAINEPCTETGRLDIGKVMLTAGTTENSISTRADGKTYFMPAAHRFVAKMYFKTTDSGNDYDTLRYHTAWLKVDNAGAGNSLYWKSDYPETADEEDPNYHNDNYAPTFYWQNRREHAFLAWTDLNKATTMTSNSGLNYDDNKTTYEYHTGTKEQKWVVKTITVRGNDVPFATEQAVVNAYKNRTDGQNEFKAEASKETADQYSTPYYWWSDDLEDFCKVIMTTNQGEDKSTTEKTSNRYLMYFFKKKLEYSFPDGTNMDQVQTEQVSIGGKQYDFVLDADGRIVARKVVENGETKYYQCTPYGHIMYDESLEHDKDYMVYIFRRNLKLEEVEVTEDYPAMAFDLTRPKGNDKTMADQPDVLQALTIDQIPKSSVMENNRVNLYFKHQFAQVQVNLKNSVDNSVMIEKDQIQSVELLGVTEKGYVFTSMNPDGTMNVPEPLKTKDEDDKVIATKSSTFKEVVATDFTDQQLKDNPYGTSFELLPRTLTEDDIKINKIVKSGECITFGRLQAIRITWKETEEEGSVEHTATYRVPEKNDQGQALRLLEAGKKYIWNMELRRGTLAVVRTEIIPWEENQEPYNADGYIDKTSSQQ